MSIGDSLRKGFRFFLMSMGVSTYSRKTLNQSEITPAKAAVAPAIRKD